jgi:DNA replicative helicase MCM subunit Mcm2 (Cdc46/Mcm family)
MIESLLHSQVSSMTKDAGIEPDKIMQEVLTAWRLLFTNNHAEEIKRLNGLEERVFGLEVEHSLICLNDTLRTEFHTRPDWTLDLGNIVLNEQTAMQDNDSRLVIRVVNFSKNHHFSLDELRMRHRSAMLTFDVIISPLGGPLGWIKKAVYECNDCGYRSEIRQRLAREREAPKMCFSCIELFAAKNKGALPPFPPRDIKLMVEDCYYEDIEYLNLRQISIDDDGNLMNLGDEKYIGVINDEYVGELTTGSIHRINAQVAVDHLPNRDFVKDTRRIILLNIHSIEESPFNVSNASEMNIELEEQED